MFPASRRTGAVARPRTRQGAVQPLRRGLQVSETSGGAQGAVRDSWESHNSSAQRRLLLRRSCARMRRQVVVSNGVPRWGTTACGLRRQRWGWASWPRPWLRASAPQPPARALPADGTESWYASCLTGELSRAVCDTSPHSSDLESKAVRPRRWSSVPPWAPGASWAARQLAALGRHRMPGCSPHDPLAIRCMCSPQSCLSRIGTMLDQPRDRAACPEPLELDGGAEGAKRPHGL
jgi:hypothetical protein